MAAPLQPVVKTSLADWTADDDEANGYLDENRERAGKKKNKKKKKKGEEEKPIPQDWDHIYDPTRPNSYEEYMHSEERVREIRDWKERLYAHRMAKRRSAELSSDEDDRPRRVMNGTNRRMSQEGSNVCPANFGSTYSSYNFAPPSPRKPNRPSERARPTWTYGDETGDDAFARRTKMSQAAAQAPPPLPPAPFDPTVSPPPPPPPRPPSTPQRPSPAAAGNRGRPEASYRARRSGTALPAPPAELDEMLQQEEEEEKRAAGRGRGGTGRRVGARRPAVQPSGTEGLRGASDGQVRGGPGARGWEWRAWGSRRR